MPNHAPFTAAVRALFAHLCDDRLGPLHLLIPRCDLAELAVKEDEAPGEVEQPVGPQQADHQFVLVCQGHRAAVETVEVIAGPLGAVGKDGGSVGRGQGRGLDRLHLGFKHLLFPPGRPELFGGLGGAIAAFDARDRQQQLRIGVEVLDAVAQLVAQVLADPLIHHCGGLGGGYRALGLDHHQRDAVHIANQIGAEMAHACGAFDA